MRTSARGLLKTASKARKLQNFGKAWKVGDKGIAFYPLYKNEETGDIELLAAGVWGYRVNDMKALGLKASFIPSLVEIDENGRPATQDIVSQFSRLAPVFIAGEKEAQIIQLESKSWPSKSAYKAALEQLENEYDAANNMDARKAVIGRLSLYISTEVLYIPVVNDQPQWDQGRIYSQTLSNERITKLMAIIDDPQYGVKDTDTYLEVQYDFVASDNKKATAGKNAPTGLTDAYKLESRFPDEAETIKKLTSDLPTDIEVIENHNYSYNKISESDLFRAFQSYSLFNCQFLDTVPEDREEQALNCAQMIEDLSIIPNLQNEKFIAELKKRIEENKANSVPEAPSIPEPPTPTEAPTLQNLMNNPARAEDDDTTGIDISDVNL